MKMEKKWERYYRDQWSKPTVYPESFLVRLLTSKLPTLGLNDDNYQGQCILDLSCGYGRNIIFLQRLGFEVSATEVHPKIIEELQNKYADVSFKCAKAHCIPFNVGSFNGLIACNSCYYLDEGITFEQNLTEIHRVIKRDGWFMGSVISAQHSVVQRAVCQHGSVVVKNDPLGVRNNDKLYCVSSEEELRELLSPLFENIKIGHLVDTFMGFRRDLYYFTCYKHE